MLTCNFCSKECKNLNSHANHSRLCAKNPNRIYVSRTSKKSGHIAWNKGLTKNDPRVAAQILSAKKSDRKPMSTEARSNISAGVKGKTGGYREGAGRSKKFKVKDSYGNLVCLQSSFELRVSEILNNLNIKWIRPKALRYDDRLYFADFYLPELDIWLDPKNDYKAKLDSNKIAKVISQNQIKLFVLKECQINEEYIRTIAQG